MKLSIIIPCFNEEATIKEILNKIKKQNEFQKEVIVIDDFSTDRTRWILENELKDEIDQLILNTNNYGKGYSIRKEL